MNQSKKTTSQIGLIFLTILVGSDKTHVFMNLIKHQQPDIDKSYLYVKDPFESKYQLVINGREKVRIKNQQKIQRHYLIINIQLMMFMKI